MTTAILVANLLGIFLPFLFRRLGIDPAIAAGPIVTTCNDVVSVSTYLLIALRLVL
jgi:magnesium transporter